MSDFTITKVLGEEPFSTPNGNFVAYTVTFEGEQGKGAAEHRRKATSPAPTEGEVIDGEIVHQGEKVLLKRVYRPQSAPSGAKSSSSTWKPEDPKRSAEIRRMAVQERGIRLLALEVQVALARPESKLIESIINQDFRTALTARFDALERDVIDAGLRAELPSA